jgi:hypothetical protein
MATHAGARSEAKNDMDFLVVHRDLLSSRYMRRSSWVKSRTHRSNRGAVIRPSADNHRTRIIRESYSCYRQ